MTRLGSFAVSAAVIDCVSPGTSTLSNGPRRVKNFDPTEKRKPIPRKVNAFNGLDPLPRLVILILEFRIISISERSLSVSSYRQRAAVLAFLRAISHFGGSLANNMNKDDGNSFMNVAALPIYFRHFVFRVQLSLGSVAESYYSVVVLEAAPLSVTRFIPTSMYKSRTAYYKMRKVLLKFVPGQPYQCALQFSSWMRILVPLFTPLLISRNINYRETERALPGYFINSLTTTRWRGIFKNVADDVRGVD